MMSGEPLKASLPGPLKKILDVGCGTGVKTVLFGSTFPDGNVYGVDLAEVPSMDAKPDNVIFIQGDIRELLRLDTKYSEIFQADSFDYIYSRAILCGLVDWPSYLQSVYRIPAPGGMYEIQEHLQKFFDAQDKVIPFEVIKELNAYQWDTNHDALAGHHGPENLQVTGFEVIRQIDAYNAY
jgi:SAM-dependent methyltransferase